MIALAHRLVLDDGDDVRGHQPPGAFLIVLEQGCQLLAVLVREAFQNRVGLRFVKDRHQVCGVVLLHALDDAGELLRTELPDDLLQHGGGVLKLLQHLRDVLLLQQVQNRKLVLELELREDARDLGWGEGLQQALEHLGALGVDELLDKLVVLGIAGLRHGPGGEGVRSQESGF